MMGDRETENGKFGENLSPTENCGEGGKYKCLFNTP